MKARLLALALLVLASAAVTADEPAKLLPPDRPIEQVIDHYIGAGLRAAKVEPAPPADDAELLRRLTLDLAGRIPTVAELAEYLGSTDPDKKTKLVDRLMSSPDYVRHQTTELVTLLHNSDRPRRGRGDGLRDYAQKAVAENRPWDRVFREVVLPDTAGAGQKGADDFLKTRVKDLNKLAIDVSSLFFGVNISCAQCHDHPLVRDWTQDHFYGMKSFFARTFENGGVLGEYDAGVVKYLPNKGKEKLAPVMFLTGKKVDAPNLHEPTKEEKKKAQDRVAKAKKDKKTMAAPPAFSLRAKLVETALEPGQREFFARSAVNRVWYRLLGRGLVMPLDQMHSENPPTHPELLAWLARDLAGHGYDLRRLTRGIVLSKAYARGSRWPNDAPPSDKLFAVAVVRPLTPMQLALALKIAAADPQSLPADRAELEKRIDALSRGGEGLAKYFPQPTEHFQVGASEALLFANNEGLLKDLLEGSGTLAARMQQEPTADRRAELAVRTVLSRPASPEEMQALVGYLQRRPDRPAAACQQVVWALLTSAEFRFNH
jgi:hypothetical protein